MGARVKQGDHKIGHLVSFIEMDQYIWNITLVLNQGVIEQTGRLVQEQVFLKPKKSYIV